jgi:L-threonylcarbamoyladenylate synthase
MRLRLLLIERAARAARRGGVIAYPTEGVWGLGCDPFDAVAVRRLLVLKQREEHKGLILVAGEIAQLMPYLRLLDEARRAAVLASWPGPVTWVVPAPPEIPGWVRGRHPGVALRVSDHPQVRALCRAFGGPLVSTSANPAGRPPALTELRVRQYFRAQLDCILPGALGTRGRPSVIRDARHGRVLRPG